MPTLAAFGSNSLWCVSPRATSQALTTGDPRGSHCPSSLTVELGDEGRGAFLGGRLRVRRSQNTSGRIPWRAVRTHTSRLAPVGATNPRFLARPTGGNGLLPWDVFEDRDPE